MKEKKINNTEGITLVALCVTIVILLILAGISINSGYNLIKESKKNELLSELEMIQHAVLERYTKEATMGNNNYPGTQKYTSIDEIKSEITDLTNDTKLMEILKNTENSLDDYYYLEKTDLEELGITKAEDTYIINYKIGLVIDITNQRTEDGEAVYVYAKDGTD